MERLVQSGSSVEFFKELVEKAIERQRVATSELSCFYLVQLLDNFVSLDQLYAERELDRDQTVAELLCHALRSEGNRRFTLLKFTGDLSLFVSGFFSDSISKKRIDLDYYQRMGGYAYSRAARWSPQEIASVFFELAAKFGRFVDVLNEVSEESSMAEAAGVLRLYERWLRTGSKRSEALLRNQGILLDSSSKRVH